MGDEFEVRLTQSTGETMLTPWIPRDSLSFRSIDPGGFGSVAFDLSRALDAADFEDDAEVAVFDAETGEQVGGGRLLNPGRGLSTSGEVWQVAALGEGPAHLQDREVPYCIIDTRIDEGNPWEKGHTTNRRLEWALANQPDNELIPGWLFTINPGALNSGYIGRLDNKTFEQFELVYGTSHRVEIGGYKFKYHCGNATSDNRVQSLIESYGTGAQVLASDNSFATGNVDRLRQIVANWPVTGIGTFSDEPVNRVIMRYQRINTSVTVGGDDDWMHIANLRVSALRYDRNGNIVASGTSYTNDYVLAHEAIQDCWARFCPRLDLANARIDETATFEHADLVWPDGITPYGVLERLMEFNLGFTWAVWEKLPNGLWRAEWRQRDIDVRYEISAEDGFEQTGPGATNLDAAYVVAESEGGAYRVLSFFTGESDDVDTSKTVKFDGKLDDTDWSEAASALGDNTLEDSRLQASAARVTVARKVFDHYTGRWVKPYMIRPGYVCRVNGVRSARDTLNDGESDGAAVFRIVSMDYSASSASAVLELDSFTVDEARAIADLLNATPTA